MFDDPAAVEAFVRSRASLQEGQKLRFSREADDVWFVWVDGEDDGGWYVFDASGEWALEYLR